MQWRGTTILHNELDENNNNIDTHTKKGVCTLQKYIPSKKQMCCSLAKLSTWDLKVSQMIYRLKTYVWRRKQYRICCNILQKNEKLECHMKHEKPSSLTDGFHDTMESPINNFYNRYCPRHLDIEISKYCWEFCDGIPQFSLLVVIQGST